MRSLTTMFNSGYNVKITEVCVFLKSLEIFGFKSFADRTRIEFADGITALLGPNGCGKSNVVDAVKWALGEQAAKTMRAEKMEDVIFNGTQTRAPCRSYSYAFQRCRTLAYRYQRNYHKTPFIPFRRGRILDK